MVEVWTLTFPPAGAAAPLARRAEADGWDGMLVADSQNVSGDAYATLTAAALATSTLRLGTGVTNPVTRHPAVTASAIATVQVESGGRAVLGIGRGDSALGHLGRKPAPVATLERYLAQVQAYLAGEVVDLDGFPSRLGWVAGRGLPKVPVDVAATGPRVIAAGARLAERVTFSVGADPGRLRWAVGQARAARAAAGLDPAGVSLGAYVNAVAHPDRAAGRELVRGSLAAMAHFSGMDERTASLLPAADRAAVRDLAARYELRGHALRTARHQDALDDAFVDRFAVIGPAGEVARRLRDVLALGLDRLVVAGHSRDADPGLLAETSARFAAEVIPRLR